MPSWQHLVSLSELPQHMLQSPLPSSPTVRRQRRKSWTISLTLLSMSWILLLLPLLEASPLRKNRICGPAKCEGDGKKFHYKEDHVYSYRYIINGTTLIEGGPSEQSGLHLSSQVTIKFLSACDAILFMNDVELWQSHGTSGQVDQVFIKSGSSRTLGKSLETFPLRFSYADGVIEEICPDPAESVSALNIKRGLLSAFQNTMRRLDLEHKGEENDVHGRCKVEYELGTATSSSLTLVRTKDINSCGDKFDIFSSVQGVPYNFGTLHQSMPAVSSTSECEQTVDRNLMSGVNCRESHRLKSLSRGAAGALTTILQKLDLLAVYTPTRKTHLTSGATEGDGGDEAGKTNEDEEADSGRDETLVDASFVVTTADALPSHVTDIISKTQEKISKRDSLLFQHEHRPARTLSSHATARRALQDFCLSLKEEVTEEGGRRFDSLVKILRGLSSPDMMNLAKEAAEICFGDRAPFDDAVEAVGTVASVTLMKDRIQRKEAPPATIQSWIASLTYIAKPDLAIVHAALPIIRSRDTYPHILLSLSSLAHSFCRSSPDCSSQQPISVITKIYERYFNYTDCRTNEPQEVDKTLMYLKGLGNFGLHTPGIQQAINSCIYNNDRMEVRVAAIEAYRRMPCGYDNSLLENVFLDQKEDSELRIAGFLGLMRCPSYGTIRLIQRALAVEEVNQVGSFIWSYMKNLQETALPSKAELQGLVADEKLSKKFSTDVRKFSRNFEISTFYDDFNFGLGADSNVVYSQDSYVPRSTSLNLTVDLFGESVNVFEATIRLESLEQYIESIFGPNGKLRSKELYNIVSSFREKRAVPSRRKLRTLSLKYDANRRYYSDPVASLSLKTFGNEILYKRKVGVEEQSELLESLNPFGYLKRLGDKDTNWQKSTMLLDSSYIIPTGVGLPLNLSAQASSLLRLQAMSMIDAGNFRAKSELKLKGKFQPSALLTVTGGMSLGVADLETGIKVRANIRTSAAVEASLHVKGSSLMHLEFGIPQSRVDILEYSSELLAMTNNEYKAIGQLPPSAKERACTGVLPDFIGGGLKFCGSSFFSLSPRGETDDTVAPYFPLNGPSHFLVTLDKANPNLMKTRIIYEWNNDEKKSNLKGLLERVMKTSSGTEDSEILSLNVDVDKVTQNVNFGLLIPHHEVKGSGKLESDVSKGSFEVSLKAVPSGLQQFHTLLSFETSKNQVKKVLRPVAKMTYDSRKFLDAEGEIALSENPGGTSFEGNGNVEWKGRNHKLQVRGYRNDTTMSLVLDGEYKNSGSSKETIRWRSDLRQLKDSGGNSVDATLSLDLSEYPDYNLGANFKHRGSEEGIDNEVEIRQGRGPTWSDRRALRVRQATVYLRSHEGSRLGWLFQVTEPSRQIDWGLELSLNTRGKSLESAINLRYAPGKNLQTSLSLTRAPGVLTFLQIGWNITLPNQQPLQFSLHLHEKTHHVYNALFHTNWFESNNVTVAMDYYDKGKRNIVNKYLQLSIQTKSTDPLKFSAFLLHHEDKESKIQFSMEYGNHVNSIEMSHVSLNKGKKDEAYVKVEQGQHVYLVRAELETDNGIKFEIKTDFGSKLADIYMSTRSTNQNGLQLFTLNYKWDASGDKTKQFLLEFFMDTSQEFLRRSELLLTYPGRHCVIGGEHTSNPEDKSHMLTGRLKWDDENYLNVNARVAPEDGKEDVVKALLQLETSFYRLNNVSVIARFDGCDERDCDINVDGSWGDNGKIAAAISTRKENLVVETEEGDDDEVVEESSNEEDGGDDDETVMESKSKNEKDKNLRKSRDKPFLWSLRANLSSTVTSLESLRISMHHTHHSPFHVKTNVDIQLPNEKEISMGSEWLVPRTIHEIWSSRAELRVKTPFVGYQSVNLQASMGQQEDSDVLAVAGIYMDNLQYSVTITGTPRFEEDGALGFDITTSDPKYDKIFGSLSYAIGDSSRFACQLGWPQVVIGLDTGYEWSSWEEFQAYSTFSSPWMPLRNINALAKIDTAQAELKLELNDKGVNGKCEWLIESFETFEIRLDATTPFTDLSKVGMILKNSFEDEIGIHSQAVAWVNDKQVGYKLQGGKSEVEEEDALAIVMNAEVEVDLIVYPTVRGTLSLEQRESKFNLALSLNLREGPINVLADLHLLDVFRFNEKITITTPFPGLVELEINLTPAIVPQGGLYNIGVNTKWRSGSDWQEAGVVIRYGDQNILLEALSLDSSENEEDEEEDEADEEKPKTTTTKTKIPFSQLIHWYSPLVWAEEIKFEYEKLPLSDSESENEDEVTDELRFPLRSFALAYRGAHSELSTSLRNEILTKVVKARLNLPHIPQPVSVEFDGNLDLSADEKIFNAVATSYQDQRREVSLSSLWEKRENFLKARGELRTPFEDFEDQHAQIMYAHNENDEMYTVDVEVENSAVGKLDWNVFISPSYFTIHVESPFEQLSKLEVRGDVVPVEGSKDTVNSVITITSSLHEIQLDLESVMEDKWPTRVSGTVTSSLNRRQAHGNVTATLTRTSGEVFNGTGRIDWDDLGREKVTASLLIKLPGNRFELLDLNVDTSYKNYEHWELYIFRPANEQDDHFHVEIKGRTPLEQFTSIEGDGSLEMGSSFLDVKKATVSGKTPSGSIDITTSWIIEEWNSFDIQWNSSYYLLLASSPLPNQNFLKLKLRNEIPTLNSLSLVDSAFYFETSDLRSRLGGSVFMEHETDESLTVKLSSTLAETSQSVELRTTFDEELNNIQANLLASHGPPNDSESIKSSVRLTTGEGSLDGEAEAEWGKDDYSSLKSTFNCSFTDEFNELHLELFNPKIKSRPGSSPMTDTEEDQRQVNIMFSGTFHKISGLHKARLQSGNLEAPCVMDLHVGYHGLKDFESSLNFSSAVPRFNVSSAGLRLNNKILGNTYEGLYGGHWGSDEASVNYNVEYEQSGEMMKFNGSFVTVLPLEKAQSAAFELSYENQVMNTDGKLRAELNSVKLIGSHYHYEASSSAGVDNRKAQLELDNHLWPFGLIIFYQYNYSGGYQGQNLPTSTLRGVEVYDLMQSTSNRLKMEGKIDTTFTGQTLTLTGSHPSRKVELTTNYEFLDHRFLHNCRFSWSPESWMGYELDLKNLTNSAKAEHHSSLKIAYPIREVVVDTTYSQQGSAVKLTMELNPNVKKNVNRKLVAVLVADTQGGLASQLTQKYSLTIKHPLLPQDIRTTGEIRVVNREGVEGKFSIDYAADVKRKLTFVMRAMPHLLLSNLQWNLTTDLRLQHSATNLDLRALHTNRHSSQELSIITLIDFKNREKLPQKSRIAFELFKELRKLLIMISTPEGELNAFGAVNVENMTYLVEAGANMTDGNELFKAFMDIDSEKPFYSMYFLHGPGLNNGLYSDGGIVDSRNVRFDISESYDNYRFSDINFYLRMNHSRLISSRLKWRPELLQDLEESCRSKYGEVRDAWSQQSDKLLLALSSQASEVTLQIWEDAKTTIGPFIQEMRDEVSLENEKEELQLFWNRTLVNNDFYSEDIAALGKLMAEEVSLRFSNIFLRLREYRRELFGDSSQLFEKTVLWTLEKLRENYRQLVTAWHKYRTESPASSLSLALLSDKLSLFFDQVVESTVKTMEEITNSLAKHGMQVVSYVTQILDQYKPSSFAFAHAVEEFVYGIVLRVSDYIYKTRDEIAQSTYYQRLISMGDDVDQLYRDLSSNDAPTNIRKYYSMFKNFIVRKYIEGDYGNQMGALGEYIVEAWTQLKATEMAQEAAKYWNNLVTKVRWLASYLHVDETIQEIIVALYTKGGDLVYQTVLEAGSRYQKAKTKFIFDTDKGIIELEQKLPMPWHAFNETPSFQELPEYQNIKKLQDVFQSSEGTIWDLYYKARPETKLSELLFPSDGHAMVVGSEYFFTFDGLAYNLSSGTAAPCVFLLAGDMVDGNFSVSIQYNGNESGTASHHIVVSSGHNTVIIDFDENAIKTVKRGPTTALLSLPVQLQHLEAFRDGNRLVVQNHRGVSVSCNLAYRICQLRVSGWYSRKTAGLLGTMDNEPTTDMIHSDRKPLTNLNDMVKSWDVSDDNSESCRVYPKSSNGSTSDPKTLSTCNKFFKYILSPLQPCFSVVKVDPYVRMCGMDSSGSGGICTAAMAYVSMCQSYGVIVQIPSQCIKCDMNGEEMIDRDVRVMDSTSSGNLSTDIVFIVEAKECNKNLRAQKKTDGLIKILEDEMAKADFVSNRYAVVVFGGDGVFEQPHPIMHTNQVFTSATNFSQYLNNIVPGNGSADVFGALAYSLKLKFRPGVSKTFILLPCSSCQPQHMTMDFSTIHYAMLEQDATLHILMNNDFSLDNKDLAKKFYGMDSHLGYTKADATKERLRGETKIRQQVRLARSKLGYCSPLALQTNGSIFTGRKLQNRRESAVKFSTVFSRRVVQTARPADCQTCYCSSDQDGVGRIQCFLCEYPHPKAIPEVDSDSSLEDDVVDEQTNSTQTSSHHQPNRGNPPGIGMNGDEDEDGEEFDNTNASDEEDTE